MSQISEKAVEILKQYATEGKYPLRSTSDLSPLEEWLLVKLAKQTTSKQTLPKLQADGYEYGVE